MLRGAASHELGGEGGAVALARGEVQQQGDAGELTLQQLEAEDQVG